MRQGQTYCAVYIQLVFAVHCREPLILPQWEEELYKYIAGIMHNRGSKSIAVNGMPDHINILLKLSTSDCIADLVREIKKSSTKFIRSKLGSSHPFNWQRGFAAISYPSRDIGIVKKYVENQKEHHQRVSFSEEVDLMAFM